MPNAKRANQERDLGRLEEDLAILNRISGLSDTLNCTHVVRCPCFTLCKKSSEVNRTTTFALYGKVTCDGYLTKTLSIISYRKYHCLNILSRGCPNVHIDVIVLGPFSCPLVSVSFYIGESKQ